MQLTFEGRQMDLIEADEFFTHQVTLPHSMVGSSDTSWRERYWVSVQDVVGCDTVLTCGIGRYPNTDVLEAFAVISSAGKQQNVRFSRSLSLSPSEMRVGPFSVEVVQAFDELHIQLEENDSELMFDITWKAAFPPLLEDRLLHVNRSRLTYDILRYVQVGRVSGHLSSPHIGSLRLEREHWWSERDHSWGTRQLPSQLGEPPRNRPEWSFLIFCPVQFASFAIHINLQEARRGRIVYLSGGMSSQGAEYRLTGVEHHLEWVEGASAPTLLGGNLMLKFDNHDDVVMQLRALSGRAHLRGGGYEGWNGWFQGHWRGDAAADGEVWNTRDPAQSYRYARAGSDHLIEVKCGNEIGYGVMEYFILPDHGRYGYARPQRQSR